MMDIRYPLSLRQVEDILFDRGIDICHETVRYWWNRFGPMFAAALRKRRLHHRSFNGAGRIRQDQWRDALSLWTALPLQVDFELIRVARCKHLSGVIR